MTTSPLTATVKVEPGFTSPPPREKTRMRFRRSDLHFHDLRREFASRLLESGVSNHAVRDWLGHTNLTTTNRYLSTCRVHLQEARRRFEQRTVARAPSLRLAASRR